MLQKNQEINHASKYLNNSLFVLEDVGVIFKNGIQALSSVELSINSREIIFITGSSGAGKTTLLKILTGEVKPTRGKVSILGKNIFLSQVFQDLRLMNRKTCRENLKLSYDPAVYQSKQEFNEELVELSKVFGIYDRLDIKINEANGGLKQKIAVIRALLTRPDVFIADEPTSSLDFENAQKLFDILHVYNMKRGTTVIWASHNRELVKRFSARIIHLDKGRVIHSGHACFI